MALTAQQTDLIKSFAIYFTLIVGNFVVGSVFTCHQIEFIKSHVWLQRGLSFLLFYLLVGLVSTTGQLEFVPPIQKIFTSFVYFVCFLLMMRLDMTISVMVLILVFVIYFIELNRDFYMERGKQIQDKEEQRVYQENRYWFTLNTPVMIRWLPVQTHHFQVLSMIEQVIYYLILALLFIGFVAHAGEMREFMSKHNRIHALSWKDVLLNTQDCKLTDRKSVWHYFRQGLHI